MQQGGPTVRRLIFPLIIVGVAVALGVWGAQGSGARNESVERFVRQILLDICEGGDAEILLGRTDAMVRAGVRQQIATVCEAHSGLVDRIDIDVIAGDVQPYPGSETATHSALIGDGAVHMLGLRLSASDESRGVRVLGYWIPQGS